MRIFLKPLLLIISILICASIFASAPDESELQTDNVQIEVCRMMNLRGQAQWKEIDPDHWDDDREKEFVLYSAAWDLALRNVDYSIYINYNLNPNLLAKVLKCPASEIEGSRKGKLIELGKRIQAHEPAIKKAIQDKKDKEKQERIKEKFAEIEENAASEITVLKLSEKHYRVEPFETPFKSAIASASWNKNDKPSWWDKF